MEALSPKLPDEPSEPKRPIWLIECTKQGVRWLVSQSIEQIGRSIRWLKTPPQQESSKDDIQIKEIVYPEGPFSLEVYKEFDQAWRHEDNLINIRLTWLLAIQGGLFTLIIFVFGSNIDGTSDFKIIRAIAVLIISWFARGVTRDIQKGILAAEKQIDCYKRQVQFSFGQHLPLPRTVFQDHEFKGFSAPHGVIEKLLQFWFLIITAMILYLAKALVVVIMNFASLLVFFRLP